jgi:hypothetical protein
MLKRSLHPVNPFYCITEHSSMNPAQGQANPVLPKQLFLLFEGIRIALMAQS